LKALTYLLIPLLLIIVNCDSATEPEDCAGVAGGTAVEDNCGTCDSDTTNDCVQDCAGVWDGDATTTECDACTSGVFDCAGTCDGTAVVDCAGICGGTTTQEMCATCTSGVFDCAGSCDGDVVVDCTGSCDGDVVVDCAGVCGGITTQEMCVACTSGVFDCAGVCDGTAVVVDCADGLVNEGNEAFFSFMMNGPDESECPEFDEDEDGSASNLVQGCLDMSDIDEKYNIALEIDPGHKGAIFGKAYMELFQIGQDELLKTTINQWENCFKHYIDEFEDDDLDRSIINNNEFEMGFPNSGNAFFSFDVKRILNFIPIITSHEDLLLRNNDNCPEISSIQDVLEDVFLYRISNTINNFDQVLGNNFVFTITGTMLEDPDQDPITLDDTEIYLMKAFMHQIRAVIYAIITYDVDVPYYDLIDDIIEGEGYPTEDMDWSWLSTSSSLLTIRSGQENSWPNAHADLNNVLSSIENAWNFLDTDNDTEYDAIQKDMVECDDGDCPTVPEVIDEIRDILNEPFFVSQNEIDFIDEITVDIKSFLTNPPQNLKTLLPTYTITTGTCEYEECEEYYDAYGNWYEECQDSGTWGCPVLTWEAETCEEWKDGWDYTLGGLFPNMTQIKFFNDIVGEDIDPEDCEEILEGSFDF